MFYGLGAPVLLFILRVRDWVNQVIMRGMHKRVQDAVAWSGLTCV